MKANPPLTYGVHPDSHRVLWNGDLDRIQGRVGEGHVLMHDLGQGRGRRLVPVQDSAQQLGRLRLRGAQPQDDLFPWREETVTASQSDGKGPQRGGGQAVHSVREGHRAVSVAPERPRPEAQAVQMWVLSLDLDLKSWSILKKHVFLGHL